MSKISIVIPILDEAKTVAVLLQHLIDNSTQKNIAEIIVVDGGSTDDSQKIVEEFSYQEKDPETSSGWSRQNIKLMTSPKGRAKQMNLGAKKSTGNVLYFLHADSYPPKYFDQLILKETAKRNLIGCFRMKFDGSYPILKISQWFTRFNFKICRGGDQSLFIDKSIFNALNGYDETFGVYEDCELINRIYDNYNFKIINDYVITSSRRYDLNGSWKLQYHFAAIHIKRWFGASAEELHRYYLKNIA